MKKAINLYFCNEETKIKLDAIKSAGYEIWWAQYPSGSYAVDPTEYDKSSQCGMWQYSSKGSVSGITGDVDLNVSYVNYSDNEIPPKPPVTSPDDGGYWEYNTTHSDVSKWPVYSSYTYNSSTGKYATSGSVISYTDQYNTAGYLCRVYSRMGYILFHTFSGFVMFETNMVTENYGIEIRKIYHSNPNGYNSTPYQTVTSNYLYTSQYRGQDIFEYYSIGEDEYGNINQIQSFTFTAFTSNGYYLKYS